MPISRVFGCLRLSRIIEKPEFVFLVFTIFFGLLFVFLFPPFQVIDEPSHFFRAYQIAQGDIIGSKKDNLTGGVLPTQVVNAPNNYARMISNYNEKSDLKDVSEDVFLNINISKKEFTAFNNTVVYPPFTYLPQAFGIKVSMMFNASPVTSLYFARLFSLMFWVVTIFCLIKIMPRLGKWTIVVVSSFPMILSQAASVSSDATINTMTIFTIGIIISIILSDNKGARYENKILFRLLFICGIILSLVKPPAVILLLLAIVIPFEKFNGVKSKAKYLILLIGLPVVITLLWNYFALKLRVELRPDLSSGQQLNFILSEPLSFLKMFVYYPFQSRIDQTIVQMYGWLGWNDIRLPLWLAMGGFISVFLTLINPEFKNVKIKLATRVLSFMSIFTVCSLITTLLYLTWIPVGYSTLYDLWGRYYVAYIPSLILIIGGLIILDDVSWLRSRKFLVIWIFFSLILVTFLIWNRYYFHLNIGYFA